MSRISGHARAAVARALPDKPVRRTVQGVDLLLPRRHPLPIYGTGSSTYGQNLVEVAKGLGPDLNFLDIGANIGDSTVQVLSAVPGQAVCIEPDPTWLPYLEANVGNRQGVSIERSLLLPPDTDASLTAVHDKAGTTRFAPATGVETLATVTAAELVERYPQLSRVRLVKSDTDGYDASLIADLASTLSGLGVHPVLFFEYDHRLTRIATPDFEPTSVWSTLAALGYERVAVWDNTGVVLGSTDTTRISTQAAVLDKPRGARGYDYWDVAVSHADDRVANATLERLAPEPLQ